MNPTGYIMKSEAVSAIVADLTGTQVLAVHAARRGGNNRIFRVDGTNGERYALKMYPAQDADPRDRLGAEWAALTFMDEKCIGSVPKPIAYDPVQRCGLYSWVDGQPAKASNDHITQMVAFLKALQSTADVNGRAGVFQPASAACFTGSSVVAQIDQRRRRLDVAAGDDKALADFLLNILDPMISECVAEATACYAGGGLDFDQQLDDRYHFLSPSDFGLHNALVDDAGRMTFLDFEYFGWDDPVKAVCDIVLHPGSAFSETLATALMVQFVPDIAANDSTFFIRLKALYPLYALIWCLIILNEFLPERWERRIMAGRSNDRVAVQEQQLDKARIRVVKIRNLNDIAPFIACT